jgi:hypothetical protein
MITLLVTPNTKRQRIALSMSVSKTHFTYTEIRVCVRSKTHVFLLLVFRLVFNFRARKMVS